MPSHAPSSRRVDANGARRRALGIALAWCLAAVASCTVADVDYAGKACPCPAGFSCNDASRCVAGAITPPPSDPCSDGIKDGDEVDVDCGGACARCPGAPCAKADDCVT